MSITFQAGHAPTGAITANYIYNGWGIGTGLLDEDGRNTGWMGTDSVCLVVSAACATANANANFAADVDGFLYQMAYHYFSASKSMVMTHFNTLHTGWTPLFVGPGTLWYWNAPAHRSVLQAGGQVLDVIGTTDYTFTQEKMDFIYQWAGDVPILPGAFGPSAQADSDASANAADSSTVDYATQAARGAAFTAWANAAYVAHYPNGIHPVVGLEFWQYPEGYGSEGLANWGVVSLLDNAYDGHEAVTASVICSPPLDVLGAGKCGGEAANYGNFLGPVTAVHAAILSQFASDLGGGGSLSVKLCALCKGVLVQ
jgi:hypothetical protein